ncbi:M20 family metallopeptidase [Paraburkholderia sp.]|uniref:M20 family metallopeptidase n=1 Tax=Paraburkholderia sp. TaxID=1926495 RepID=UPI0023A308DE|nr:M20 family metallopeptidase [Paraburkholderia sp.]MDE1184391.1 M20 family metallopeptidase [Paraburkholderia sp.]
MSAPDTPARLALHDACATPVPEDGIVELLTTLVRIPSRGGVDPYAAVLGCVERWFDDHRVAYRRLLSGDGTPVGLYAQIDGTAPAAPGARKRPFYVLDATLDTAGFGDPETWTHPPDSARIVDGWMHGRGCADSKAAAAIFAHLAAAFGQRRDSFAGTLGVLFDLDEHTGRFGGARAFFDHADGPHAPPRPDGMMIGYPGLDRIMVGGRGFLRARIVVRGIAAHSGGSGTRGMSALVRGAALVDALNAMTLSAAPDESDGFDKPAQLTITGIQSGDGGFTQVPDRCELTLDLRLTPRFDEAHARRALCAAIDAHDRAYPVALASAIEWLPGWPAYRVPDSHPMVAALQHAAHHELGATPPCAVAGPSNLGNYVASLGVPALCGFGVRGEGIHAANERIELASIAPVYRIYHAALRALLHR